MTVRTAIVLAGGFAGAMAVLIGHALVTGAFWQEGSLLLSLAWGRVTLADLYVGFGLFSGWVLFRERHVGRALVFVVLTLSLGNLFTCIYVLIALLGSRGDWAKFWLGHRSERGTGEAP